MYAFLQNGSKCVALRAVAVWPIALSSEFDPGLRGERGIRKRKSSVPI
jgi:hypothetical protein